MADQEMDPVETDKMEDAAAHTNEKSEVGPEYIAEVTGFPGAKFDDQVDATTQALHYLSTKGQEPAFLLGWGVKGEPVASGNPGAIVPGWISPSILRGLIW